MTIHQENVSASASTTPAFVVGSYFGVEIGAIKKIYKLINEAVKNMGLTEDPSLKSLAEKAEEMTDAEFAEEMMKADGSAHLNFQRKDVDGVMFVEVQMSAQLQAAYIEILESSFGLMAVIAGFAKTLVGIIKHSSLINSLDKFTKLLMQSK